MSYTLSLIVPCYNEARTIEICIERVLGISDGYNFLMIRKNNLGNCL